jgi:NADPH:quinone reductase-like Zn-dependent oxidoreductase
VACTASTKLNAKGVAKLEFCKSLGSDVVIDYGTAEWSDVLAGKEYDMILDTVGGAYVFGLSQIRHTLFAHTRR